MKKHLLFNQSFGTEGSPNQTGKTLTRENRIGLKSYLRRTLMLLFAVLVMSMANIGMAWADTLTETHNGSSAGVLNYTSISTTSGTITYHSNSSAINVGSNTSASFTVSSFDGSNISSIVFTQNSSYPINTLTTSDGEIVKSEDTYTFTPSSLKTSYSFTLTAQEKKNCRVSTVAVTLKSNDGEYFSKNFSYSGSSAPYTINATKSNASTDISISANNNSSLISSSALQLGNGKQLTIASSGHNIKKIVFVCVAQGTMSNLSANTGTYSSNVWTAGADTKTVTFTSSGSNANIVLIRVDLASGGGCTSITPTWSTDYSSTTLNVGATSSTPVVGKDGSSGAVTFSSSDTYIATVNSSGVVTGVGAGTATITATVAADGGKCEGTVTKEFTIKAGITYNANGADDGSVPTDASTYAYNANITIKGNTGSLVKDGKIFNGWNTRSDGTGTHYEAGATMKMPSKSTGVTLYAEWVGYATSWEWWNSGQSDNSTTFTYITGKNYICSFASSASTAVASWDITGTIVYRGVKMKTKDHYMYFWVPTGKRVSITFGYMSAKPTFTVGGVNKAGDLTTSTTDSATVTYTTTADTKFYIENETATNTAFTVKSVKIEDDCTAPTAVYVTQTAGSADMVAGESFTLSAATSTGVEEGATYQWYRNSTEVGTNLPTYTVPSCTKVDAGTYWCKITNPCGKSTTNSTGFGIKVWQVLLLESSTWNSYDLTSTGTKTGEVTRQLTLGTYYIKLTHNNGVDFGVNTGETISEITATTPSAWTLYNGENNIKLTVSTAGNYTFDVDYTSADYPKLSVTYPPSTISGCDKIYFCPTVNSIATGSARFSIYFFNATESGWANCYLVSGTDFADDAKYVAYAPATTNGWTKMIVVRDDEYASSFDGIWNQSQDIIYNGYNYIVGTGYSDSKITTNLNSFYSSTTPAMDESEYCVIVGGTTTASTNLPSSAVTYISSDEAKATVGSTTGVITGVAAGTATITAKVGTCTVGTATVTVYAAPSVALSSSSVTYGASAPTLTPSNFATITGYSSSTTGTATINGSGVISIAGAGTTTFTVTGTDLCGNAANATTSTFTVNKATPTKYDFSVNKTVLCGEETATLTLAGSQSGVTYELREDSSTPIADIEKSGTGSALTWTGLGAGNYVVYAVETANYEERQMNSSKITISNGTATSITTQPTTPVAATVGSACSITGLVAAGTSPTYQWYTCNSDGSGATAITSTGAMSFTGYTSATLGLTPTAAGATYYKCVVSGSCGDPVTSNVVTVNATAAASLTAISADVQYNAADMANITFTGSDQHFTGLSTNHLFQVYGTLNSTDAFGKNETIGNITDDISTKSFTSALYITAANNTSSTSDPTQGAIEFITPSTSGILYLYLNGTASTLTLKKKGTSTSTSLSGAKYKAMTVDANTHYFINGAGSGNRGLYAIKYVSTYAVTITPTNVTKTNGATGTGAAIKGKAYTATFTANTGYTLPNDVTVTIGGESATKGTDYTWTISDGTATLTILAANVTGAISITVTGVAAESYSITYHCNDAESGCPSNVAAAYTLPSPLPTGLTKDGYDFGGWFTDSECTVAAVAGAALTGNTNLYAKWTVHSASECITITNFATSNTSCSNNIPDNNSKYFYGYKGTVDDAHAVTITSNDGNDRGQNSGVEMRLTYNKKMRIYANNTTNATPAGFENVVSVSFKWKFIASGNSGNTELTSSYTVKVGSTTIANAVSITGKTNDGYATVTIDNLAQLNGYIEFLFGGSSSSYNVYLDDIEICTADMASCTTPTLPTATLNDQALCEGADIATWTATPTNASTITGNGESISYSWKKKGSETVLGTGATFDLGNSATESQAGTYVVTVTVSKAGYTSATVSEEIELGVTESTEVTSITADKATVYEGNSVTLTATANTTVTWQWYTCTNAAGDGESSIGGATSAAYAIASAPAAGTHYYKVKATSSCGTASLVYALVVSEAAGGDCFHFVSVIPASDFNASSGASLVTPTHATTLEGGTMKVGSQQVTFTEDYGLKMESSKTVSITLDAALEAGNVVIVKGTSGTKGYGITINGVNFYDADNKTFDVSYTVSADDGLEGQTALTVSKYSGSAYLQEVKITGCGESCTDPEVTASVNNTTACAESSVTFTATGAHAEATYQWQKLDGTWTNISDETASTYTIASVVAGNAGKYRVIASHNCSRTSNEVTLSVPSAPNFGSTVPASVSVMQTIALSINTVEATDAVKYRWYKSADDTWDAGDVEIGTNKELIKAYDSEAIGSPSYYIFCRAQNACGIATSSAIAVNVIAYVEEDCATKGNEGEAEFGFTNTGCGSGNFPNTSTPCWNTNSKNKFLTYTVPEGKYFKTAKVTVSVSGGTTAAYGYSTDSISWTYVTLSDLTTSLAEKTINLTGNIKYFRISRNFDPSYGQTSNTFYLSKACFEYTDACTATTVAPDESSKTYEMGGGSFTEPTFTVKHGGMAFDPQPTLTYSSSNEDIASVEDDGTVTFNGEAGTVTITASYAGGTISATDYCASSGSYTITVSCPGGAPKVVASGSVDMSGCNSSVTLLAKTQSDGDFADGTYQWLRNGTEIDGATNSSYTATQAGTYTVEYTSAGGCTSVSTNSAVVTSETTEPEVERLVPFQYYHVNKTYSDQMKMRHLFAVKNSGTLDGKHFKMYVSRNGGAATDVTSSNALVVVPNGDGHVDTVMVDLNKLSEKKKYSENDELVFTCKAIDCDGNVSDVYKNTITMRVIGATPTLALICSGSSKAEGTRKTGELTVGGDFLTGYNVADLCEQTGSTSFDANTEWGLYTDLKTQYIVTPVNGYAVFNKLNYEPFDILLLTDYPKASKSDAAADVLDDMAALCDYRPMLSFKTHMVAKSPSKWAEKGFTTSPVVTKADGRLNLNIVCYAHPMFNGLKSGDDVYTDVGNTSAPLVYTMLTGTGFESSKGMQGFELAAAENFVTIGLTHYNGTITKDSPLAGEVEWTPDSEDRMLVTVAERQANPEARFILFSLNCGAQSKLTDKGEEVVLACLNYLLGTAEGTIAPADCSFTFDNGDNNEHDASWYASNCPLCTGTKGDGLWTTAANWGPDYRLLPGEFTSVRIKKPVEVNDEHAHVMEVRVIDEGSIDIPANKALDVKSTIRRMDGSEIYPTEENDIHVGSASTGNGTLIFNNDEGDTKARVDMYSKGFIDGEGVKNYQYIGTPFVEINALYNYYGSWIYYWKADGSGWKAVKNGGPMTAWTGYCITQETPTYHQMSGTLAATGTVDINVPADANMVVGNSWTAPIDINALTTDDLEGLTANIYFFNTGVDKEGTAGAAGSRYAGGTYVTIPVEAARYEGEDDHINSLQGFFVKNTGGSAGTLHLDYERHVRKTTRDNILSDEMHAPARRTALSSDEPVVLKMKVCGENYDDKLLLLEREDFTEGFDNGWDGDKWDGNESALYIYTTDNNGTENSVSAIPELEGTIIGFRAGEDEAYTLHFEYLNSDETLYLYDVENNTYTQIMTGMTYRFFTTDNEKHARFIITRSNGQEVATGVESTSGSLDRSKAKKLLIEDKMFIIVNGMLYDATGKVVK